MKLLFFICVVIAISFTFTCLTRFPIHHGHGFVTAGTFFMAASAWNASKAVQDDDDNPDNNDTGKYLVVFLVSCCLTGYGIYALDIDASTPRERLFEKQTLLVSVLFLVDSVFSLAKMRNR